MTSRGRLALFVVALIVAAGAVWWLAIRNAAHAAGGALSVVVRGRINHGSMQLPATIHWCPVTRTGLLEAVSGDSGVAVILYERDSLTAVPHAVVPPSVAALATRPVSSVVMRWVRIGRDTALVMFRSVSGTVRLSIASGLASGDLNARLLAATGVDSVTITGTFRAIPIAMTAAGCS